MTERWIVTGVPRALTDGGSLRAHHIFRELARRTDAAVIERGGGRALVEELARHPGEIRSNLASAQLLGTRIWPLLRRLVKPAVLDLFDHPALHADAMGTPLRTAERRRTDRFVSDLIASFRRVVVVSQPFADMMSLGDDVRVVIPNGTDTERIRQEPIRAEPVVAMVSGATPGRGIEALVAAVEELRTSLPEARLELALGVAGPPAVSRAYLREITAATARHAWVRIRSVSYGTLSEFLGSASVLAVLPPAHPYWDVALPVKLFDSLAAGRPVVATPRVSIAALLARHDAGIAARSDRTEDVAAALHDVLRDPDRARTMGANARRAAVEHYDWTVLSTRLADAVVGPAKPVAPAAHGDQRRDQNVSR